MLLSADSLHFNEFRVVMEILQIPHTKGETLMSYYMQCNLAPSCSLQNVLNRLRDGCQHAWAEIRSKVSSYSRMSHVLIMNSQLCWKCAVFTRPLYFCRRSATFYYLYAYWSFYLVSNMKYFTKRARTIAFCANPYQIDTTYAKLIHADG